MTAEGSPTANRRRTGPRGRHARWGFACVAFVLPHGWAPRSRRSRLYDLCVCRSTGFGGTPERLASVEVVPGPRAGHREVTIRFDTNVANALPWRFTPTERSLRVRVGEVHETTYIIENLTDRPTVGTAVYNVTPFQGGGYFTKIQCFCFEAQPLGPRERLEVPMVFYVDPAFDEDRSARGVDVITLSYTYFPHRGEVTPASGS